MEYIYIYILILLLLLSACLCVASNDLILTIFLLALTILSGIFIFPFLDAEYVMVIFLIIYLGAIVVFFLFGVMLLNLRYNLNENRQKIGFLIFVVFFFSLFYILCYFGLYSIFPSESITVVFELNEIQFLFLSLTNVEKIGLCLYTEFSFLLIIGMVTMLIAILGCIAFISNNENKK